MSSITPEIKPRDCGYQCGTRIYWNTAENAYFEVFTKSRHYCPNRINNKAQVGNEFRPGIHTTNVYSQKPTIHNTGVNNNTNRPYFSKKPWPQKPKMSNSFELLTGPISEIQKKYEILSDIVIIEYSGKIHGSQQSRDPKTGLIDLLVYYEVPEGKREEVKQRFKNFIRTVITLPKN